MNEIANLDGLVTSILEGKAPLRVRTAAARGAGHPIGLARELGAATVALCGAHTENATDPLEAALRACAPPDGDGDAPELEIRERRARCARLRG